MGTLGAVLTEPPDPPHAAGPLTPVLLALLAKDPAERPNAEGAETALRAVTGGAEPALPPTAPLHNVVTGPVPTRPARRRGPYLVPVLAVLAALVVTTAVGATVRARDGTPDTASGRTTAADTSTRATAPQARFASRPNPCGLITAEQATRYIHGRFVGRSSTSAPSTMPR
ncbi:hypothetical protein [Actinomadura sp. HBU206391]|uniref:hypothetical protein n=1 Tax=Actinomadura sp. HBU206391 TaxID=2731692 RepID=UPI001C9C4463|nr:hypothetical protein [Actinomadura sp. HBU206391]